MAKISIIMPIYKSEKFIRRSLDSILSQTFSDFDLILVDDGSPDSCPQICDEYKEKDNRVRVIHQENMGVAVARNAGLEYAMNQSDSEWICWVDSDDWVEENYLSTLYQGVVGHNVDVSVLRSRYVFDSSAEITEKPSKSEYVLLDADEAYKWFGLRRFGVFLITPWGKLYKKSLYSDIRYPIGKINEDQYVTYKLLFKANKIAFSSEILYNYVQTPDSIMRAKWTPKKLDTFGSYDEQIAFLKQEKAFWAYITAIFHLYVMSILQFVDVLSTEYRKSKYPFVLLKKYVIFLIKFLPFVIPYVYNSIRTRIKPIFK